jgi:predicted Zn finger-like uncharacterized protein
MRLICPKCNAQYEVDAAVIPEDGRDVQCSNCGHTWYQLPSGPRETGEEAPDNAEDDAPEAAEPETPPTVSPAPSAPPAPGPPPAPAAPTEAAAGPRQDAAPSPRAQEEPGAEDDLGAQEDLDADEETGAEASEPAAQRRALDAEVLDILREEAAREKAARRKEVAAETFSAQPDLGLDTAGGVAPGPRARRAAPPARFCRISRRSVRRSVPVPTGRRPRRRRQRRARPTGAVASAAASCLSWRFRRSGLPPICWRRRLPGCTRNLPRRWTPMSP